MKYDLIIPIYNIQNELDACLDSIRRQTHGDFHAILVDDGSTDGSSQIARDYAERDFRFEYYRKENGGLSDARNFGMGKISSAYVFFVDGDDFLEADALEAIDRELAKSPVDVLEFNGWVVKDGERVRKINFRPIEAGVVKNGQDYFLDNIKARSVNVSAWSKAVRSELLLRRRHFFAKGLLHEDELWTPRLYFLAETVRYADKCLYNYVWREGSITHRPDKSENARHAKRIYRRLEAYYRRLDLAKRPRRILLSYLSRQMIEACRMSPKEGMTAADKKFILRNARDARSVGKALLFLAAPGRYGALSQAIKKIIRY